MTVDPMLFPLDYADGRARFRGMAQAAGFTVESHVHPYQTGPQGDVLACDVARLGPADAEKVLVVSSGTHGVEGFCGSGCQAALLASGVLQDMPDDSAVVLVHAINPYGFAWLRRTNEDNIDLNRNFIDHANAPANPAYDEIHDWVVPADWHGPARAAADKRIEDYIAERGLRAFQVALTGGQYTHPTGLFYGGQAPAWSNITWRAILQTHCQRAQQVIGIDLHTGLGPRGVGEAICVTDEAEFTQAKALFGDDVTWTGSGEAVSAKIGGSLLHATHEEIGNGRLVMMGLEYGTHPIPHTLEALRAENWLAAMGDLSSGQTDAIKQALRDAFYIDEPDWKDSVVQRLLDLVGRVKAHLS